jgi:peptidoglycan hydrolase-like protein with peptidoglycan-binding domain
MKDFKSSIFALLALTSISFSSANTVISPVTDIDPNAAATCAIIDNNLRYRDTNAKYNNDDVSVLQDFLNGAGYLKASPNGFFGKLTLAAVKSFQNANGISPSGYVGPVTRAKIQDIDCNGQTTPVVPRSSPTSPTKPTDSNKPYVQTTSDTSGLNVAFTGLANACQIFLQSNTSVSGGIRAVSEDYYVIDFGDGSQGALGVNCGVFSVQHMYATAGVYTVKLVQQAGSQGTPTTPNVIYTTQVNVGGVWPVDKPVNPPIIGTLYLNVVAPMTVSAAFPKEWQQVINSVCSTLRSPTQSPAYGGRTFKIDWGDNTGVLTNLIDNNCSNHVYQNKGTYTVKATIYDYSDVNQYNGSFTRTVWTGQADITVGDTSTGNPAVSLTYPTGGQSYAIGATMKVYWQTSNIPTGATMIAQLDGEGKQVTLGQAYLGALITPPLYTSSASQASSMPAPGVGSYEFLLNDNGLLTPGKYKLTIALGNVKDGQGARATSDGYITISPKEIQPSAIPTITVVSPANGSTYTIGDNIPMTFTVDNAPENSQIQYSLTAISTTGSGNSGGTSLSDRLAVGSNKVGKSWQTGPGGYVDNPGTYEISAVVTQCNTTYGCNAPTGKVLSSTSNKVRITISATNTSKIDMKVNGSDGPVSLNGAQNVNLTWLGDKITNCSIYISRSNNLDKVDITGSKTAYVDPSVNNYVSLQCNKLTSVGTAGDAIADYVVINNLTTPPPLVTYVQSRGIEIGKVYPGEYSTIGGNGLSGQVTVSIAGKSVPSTSDKDAATTFLVPSLPSGYTTVSVTNSSGQVSNSYNVLVVTNQAPPTTTSSISLADPVLVSSSPVSQYVIGGTTFSAATFTIKTAQLGALANLRELRFSTTGPDAIQYITAAGMNAPVTAGAAKITGLSIPLSSSGVDIPVVVTYSGLQNSIIGGTLQAGVASTSVTLNYIGAVDSNSGAIITNTTPVSSNLMTVVASKPLLSMESGGQMFSLGTDNKIAQFSITADANGKLGIDTIPLVVSSSAINSFNLSNVRLFADGVPATSATVSSSVGSGNTGLVITFNGGSYTIAAGKTTTFSVYGTINGSYMGPPSNATISTQFADPTPFIWVDQIGGGIKYSGSRLMNFPTNSYKIVGGNPTATASLDPMSPGIDIGYSVPNVPLVSLSARGVSNTLTVSGELGITPSSTCVDITRNIHRGDESKMTTLLQEFLISKGLLSDKASGFYGDLTVEAVKAYQHSKGMPITGMVYDFTRLAIKKDSCGQ